VINIIGKTMQVKNLHFENVRSFVEADINLVKSNLINGYNYDTNDGNGVGKSSLLAAILLLLGGSKLTDINLKKFVRDGEKAAVISGSVEVGEDLLEITRVLKAKGTGSLKLAINGEDQEFQTSKLAQEEIFKYIGSPENFKKFRIIDDGSGINILDFTSGQLRKTLMGLCQDKYDSLRKKLLDKKNIYEKFNKSAVVSKHAPSESRLQVLQSAIKGLDTTEMIRSLRRFRSSRWRRINFLLSAGSICKTRILKIGNCKSLTGWRNVQLVFRP